MQNNFFKQSTDPQTIRKRLLQLETAKIGFYSIGLYPASLAYNCAMQTDGSRLLLAPRTNRELLGAFPKQILEGMDKDHINTLNSMSSHLENGTQVLNTLSDLILRCELVVLAANSNHIESDLNEACRLRNQLNRNNVVLACLSGSFSHDSMTNESYVLCEKYPNLSFFSGFHRHSALRNPLDSFTANFCNPNALVAIFGARMLDSLSPNIQVSAGVHNVEGQYIKAAKNISSIFAGFGYTYHQSNPGVLPTLLTLLLDQCMDQAASVSMCRKDRNDLYNKQPFSLTELGYGVQKIEASIIRDGDKQMVRDHTFSQLTAMVADVRGSMMPSSSGLPTRNFQAGQILARKMKEFNRCPFNINELLSWCEESNLKEGSLEGFKSLKYWPQIIKKYSIPINDASMTNLLYLSIYGTSSTKEIAFNVMTKSRELTNYCQESVRPTHSRMYADALNNLNNHFSIDLLINAIISEQSSISSRITADSSKSQFDSDESDYIRAMNLIENTFDS